MKLSILNVQNKKNFSEAIYASNMQFIFEFYPYLHFLVCPKFGQFPAIFSLL